MNYGHIEIEALQNRNVRLAIFMTATGSLAASLWGTTVLSFYLKSVPPSDNAHVGIAEGLQGLAQIIIALPMGILSDRMGCEPMLKVAACFGFLGVISIVGALSVGAYIDGHQDSVLSHGQIEFFLFCGALSIIGMYDGTNTAALEAIFQASISNKARASLTTLKYMARTGFSAAGPILSAILFYVIGDSWSRAETRSVFYVGIVLTFIPITSLLFFRDSLTLQDDLDSVCDESAPTIAITAAENDDSETWLPPAVEVTESDMVEPLLANSEESSLSAEELEAMRYYIPRLVLLGDVLAGIASGTTVKFFPLFFGNESKMSPIEVNAMYSVVPILIAIFAFTAQKISRHCNRVVVPVICSSIGITLLTVLWALGRISDSSGQNLWANKGLVASVFILRTAFMNCSSALRKSILNDFVDTKRRAWWNGLDSISRFSWSGSAVIGGVLADKYGYGASFLMTAILQFASLLTFSCLLRYRKYIR